MLTMQCTLVWMQPFLWDVNIFLHFWGQNLIFLTKDKRSGIGSCCDPLQVLSREFLQNSFLHNSFLHNSFLQNWNSAHFGFAPVCLPRHTRAEILRSSITQHPTEGFRNAQCQHFRIYTTYIPLNSTILTTTLALMCHRRFQGLEMTYELIIWSIIIKKINSSIMISHCISLIC